MRTLHPWIIFFAACLAACAAPPPPAAHPTYDVLIDTDLGGDPDDIQSLYRLVHYSDVLHVRGIVSTPCRDSVGHPWDTLPQVSLIQTWITRIDVEHLRDRGYTALMPEDSLLTRVKAGSQQPGPPRPGGATEGSRWIAAAAASQPADRPLWVLVWGSLTTVVQALHDAPEIAGRIRIYSIGSTNTLHDSLSRRYLLDFMETQYPGLWWIENGTLPKGRYETFRGVYQGGDQTETWGNQAFVATHIRGHGSTHNGMFAERCGDVFPVATSPAGTLKEGDSPSMLYLLSPVLAQIGDVDDPTRPSWGGQFRLADSLRFPHYYIDLDLPPKQCQATISQWRRDFLADWAARWDRYGDAP
ncbi:MAG: hypothetical protein OHK0039_24050 [Bacteroidia bacterium]